jgi:hypothetical protein
VVLLRSPSLSVYTRVKRLCEAQTFSEAVYFLNSQNATHDYLFTPTPGLAFISIGRLF